MNNRNRKPLIGLIALSAALAMPMAFAQSETEEAAPPQTGQVVLIKDSHFASGDSPSGLNSTS